MKTFAPDYYGDFRCLMGDCAHSCCIGWEIDIDAKTADYYKNIPGEFGKRLAENIDFTEDGGTFHLCENEHCPFLNEKGLCDIIINLGEEAISQVCDDHPRFRNFFESRTEIGLGLCCEAVAKLVLEKTAKTVMEEIGDDGEEAEIPEEEKEFFSLRQQVFDVIFDEEKPFEDRIKTALQLCGTDFSAADLGKWAEVYLSLERLDEIWTNVLKNIKTNPALPRGYEAKSAEQLLCYFVFRHLAEAPFDGRLGERIAFAVLSFYMTEKAAEQVGIYEAARLYSSEIEYSDENIEILLDYISGKEDFNETGNY